MGQPAYKLKQMQREDLSRGVVAVRRDPQTVAVSWRYLSSDPMQTTFHIYRNGKRVTEHPIAESTLFFDANSSTATVQYEVRPVVKGIETHEKDGSFTLAAHAPIGYLEIPMQRPEAGVTPDGEAYTYELHDTMVGDADGDGTYELFVAWEPSNRHDNAHDGYTGNVFLDCYRLTGERLWRIDLGHNIRAGAHYTQWMVYDLNGDNRCEVVFRTSDGTIDGTGKVIGDPTADYRSHGAWEEKAGRVRNRGRILNGNEYLTLFSGLTGEALYSTEYQPPRGDVRAWGDHRANRSDRFLAAIAYLDGKHPSVVMCRGYYTRTVLAAYDWDGTALRQRWLFDTNQAGNEAYAGQGNHNLRVADVDGDGCDEIIYGSCTIDHDGTGLYSTGLGHGDALHVTQFSPDDRRLQVWACHENKRDGATLRDAATGAILFQLKDSIDVGRCLAADIDPTNRGLEMWSLTSPGICNLKGEVIAPRPRNVTINMAVWWDGDLLRELLDKNVVAKYDWKRRRARWLVRFEGAASNNGTKSTPCLAADVLGDWREEVLLRTEDHSALRIYISTEPTPYRFHTFMEDPMYRTSVAMQNVGYNQPTQASFYLGADMPKGVFRGYRFK